MDLPLLVLLPREHLSHGELVLLLEEGLLLASLVLDVLALERAVLEQVLQHALVCLAGLAQLCRVRDGGRTLAARAVLPALRIRHVAEVATPVHGQGSAEGPRLRYVV